MPESLTITAPATSANLGPGFDTLAVALDLVNTVTITRRPGPLEVRVAGEGAAEVPTDERNLVCRALAVGVSDLDGLLVECENRIPFGRGLGSSAAAVCAGLVAANGLARLRWSPDDLLAKAAELEGHADNAAACLEGGLIAVGPGPHAVRIPIPDGLLFLTVVPTARVSTEAARAALPASVAHADASFSLGRAVGLALALERGELDDIGPLLEDRLHEPYRGPLVPGLATLREAAAAAGALGVTISGSGPTALVWTRVAGSAELARALTERMASAGHEVVVRAARIAPGGIRARWVDTPPTSLARAIG